MHFEVTHENRILTLVEASELEIRQLEMSLVKKVENYNFLPAAVKARWDGIISYFHKKKYVPIGLWSEIKRVCETYNYDLKIDGLGDLFYNEVSREEFENWVDDVFIGAKNDKGEDFFPHDYQIETAYGILRNKLSVNELTTAAGKSLIMFMCIAYFQEKKISEKFLIVVPSIDLVIQAHNDFHEYNSFLLEENRIPLEIKQIHGGEKKDFLAKQNIHVATFQSLNNFNNSYFLPWDTVIVDECHRAKSKSIKDIVGKCVNSKRRFGLTGTTPKQGTLDSLTLQAYLGPKIIEIKADALQKSGRIAEIDIAVVELLYPDDIRKRFDLIQKDLKGEDKGKLLKLEQDYIITYEPRLEVIKQIVSKISKNQLVLFHRQKYGKEVVEYLKKHTDKEVMLIYGNIDKDTRTSIKKSMEQGENKILVASYGTLSTGVNIKAIHFIHFIESFKSDVIVRQSIGRGLRLHKDKDKLRLFDFVDVLNTKKNNMLFNHSKVRRTIYKEQGFDYQIQKIPL